MTGKKIKFALKMNDNTEVRTLQELKEAFELNQMTAYFLDGKLELWLLDRYYKELAEKISHLDKSDPELKRKLCEIFEVEYEEDSLSIEEIEERNERIKKLKEITDDEDSIKNVDKVAFSQEELADLLEEGETTIYLCGTDFHIPVSKKGITYIGVETKLDMTQEEREIYQENDIELVNLLEDCSVDNRLLAGNRNAEIEQIVLKIEEQIVSMIKILLKTATTREKIITTTCDILEAMSSSTTDAEFKKYIEAVSAMVASGNLTPEIFGFSNTDISGMVSVISALADADDKNLPDLIDGATKLLIPFYRTCAKKATGYEQRFLMEFQPYFENICGSLITYMLISIMEESTEGEPVATPVAASTKQAAATTTPMFGSSKPVQTQPVSTSPQTQTATPPAPVVIPDYTPSNPNIRFEEDELDPIVVVNCTINGKKFQIVSEPDNEFFCTVGGFII